MYDIANEQKVWFNMIDNGFYMSFVCKGGYFVNDLSQRIREKREKQNLTIEDLSLKTKISISVLKDIEAGKFDRYDGDEAYVKMYLKKISQVLDMDAMELTQEYVALTQEIELEKLQEKQIKEEARKEEVVKRRKNFSFKVPQLTRKPSVYEDRSHMNIIRAVIVLIIICLIVVVFWYGFYTTRKQSEKPEFKPSTQTQVEGEVTPDQKDDETNNDGTNNDDSQDNTTPSQDSNVTFTRTKAMTYEVKLPEGTEEFTFKMEFGNATWASLKVNGQSYNDFKEKIYHNNDSQEFETVELKFKVADFENLELKNGYSMGHHYYINGQELPLDEKDISEGVSRLKLILVKE